MCLELFVHLHLDGTASVGDFIALTYVYALGEAIALSHP